MVQVIGCDYEQINHGLFFCLIITDVTAKLLHSYQIDGPRHGEKTCLRGFQQHKAQTNMQSYRD